MLYKIGVFKNRDESKEEKDLLKGKSEGSEVTKQLGGFWGALQVPQWSQECRGGVPENFGFLWFSYE